MPTTESPTSPNGRVGFEITFWIVPANRVEFLQTADYLLSSPCSLSGLASRSCFEQVSEGNVFLWRESWGSRTELDERLQSAPVRTLLGAIGVLGKMRELKIVEFSDRAEASRGEG